MSTPGYYRIDGPPPSAPLYGLLQAAEAPAGGVRVVPDTDASGIERWGNGVIVWPYPNETGEVTDACAPGSNVHEKSFGNSSQPTPSFNPMTLDISVTCTTYKVWDHNAWIARARAVFDAVQSAIMAREFLTGAKIPANPHLADGNGTFPNGDTVTSVKNGIAILEDAIAQTERQGLIHVPPSIIIALATNGFVLDNTTKVVRTLNGTVVIPDMGYAVAGSHPPAHATPTATQSWIYATGPADIRQSEVFVMPDQPSQAVDRGSGGATTGRPNSVTYRVERYAVVDWDTVLQAAVLVDRCKDTC
jgi:hypothetical protein